MANYSEQMQRIFDRYVEETGIDTPSTREVSAWAISNNLWQPKPADIIAQCASDMARALRDEYRTDQYGRKYRAKHAFKVTKNGKQLSLWVDIDNGASRKDMQKAFIQRRKQVVGDCHQLKIDMDYFNDSNPNVEPIQIVFDFTEDLEELEFVEKIKKAS